MLCKHCNKELNSTNHNCCETCDAYNIVAELIIAALIKAGPNEVMRTNHKFDEPNLRAVIYEALQLES